MEKFDLIMIGNGPSVMDYECGIEIDSIPKICRFNDFRIKGFQKHVGNRTTHWITFFSYGKRDLGFDDIICTCHRRWRWKKLKRRYPKARHFPPQVRKHTIRELGHKYPTKGALALIYFVHYTDFKNIAIYGFDHFSRDKHHYSNAGGSVGDHNPEKEKVLFQKYLSEEKVKLFKPPKS